MAAPVARISATEALASLHRLGVSFRDLTAVNRRIASAVLPIYQREIPRRSGRLAGSAHGSARRLAAVIIVGGGDIEYAGPVTFGWRAHSIEPNRWDERAKPQAEPIAFGLYEAEINAIIARTP